MSSTAFPAGRCVDGRGEAGFRSSYHWKVAPDDLFTGAYRPLSHLAQAERCLYEDVPSRRIEKNAAADVITPWRSWELLSPMVAAQLCVQPLPLRRPSAR